MSGLALLTVIAPVAIEEVLVDWLLENAPELGFCSGPINGHSERHGQLSLSEQVSGRKRQIRFEVAASDMEITQLLERLRQDFARADLAYWVMSLTAFGRL
jgi:hypothetical protein